MHIAKRITSMCFSLLLLMMNAAGADVPFLKHSKDWNLDGTSVEMLLKADVTTHMPFDDDRFAMLKPILDMLSLRIVTGEDEGRVTIGINEYDVLTMQYRGNETRISSLPDVTYISEDDAKSKLLGEELQVDSVYDMLGLSDQTASLMNEIKLLFDQLPGEIEEHGKRTSNTTNISGYGKAAYRYDYTFTIKEMESIREMLYEICPEGWLRDLIGPLTFSGKQTLRIYFDQNDVLLRAEYNGGCGLKEDLRTVKLIYKQAHDETVDKVYLELTSPAKKGTNKNSLTYEYAADTTAEGRNRIAGSFSYTETKDKVTSIRKGNFDLVNTALTDADQVSGEILIQSKLNGAEAYSGLTVAPELMISGTEKQPYVSGSITVLETYANKPTEHGVISIEVKPAEALEWHETTNTIDLSALDAAELQKVQQNVAASIATAIVRPLIVMMGEEGNWFFKDLPSEAVEAIIDAAEMPQN